MDVPITRLVSEARSGDPDAQTQLFTAVYDELKVIARARLRGGGPPQTLNTTALVHEAYVRLFEGTRPNVADRAHFYALSSRAMRHVLVDHFRRRRARKRGGGEVPVTLLDAEIPAEERGDVLLALDEALRRLERLEPRLARVVECRFFGGMTDVEIGHLLDVTDRTVRNDWRKARAWLARELQSETGDEEGYELRS
jgi:RNA polymerase sigma factor (TIGR02999 family)